MNTEPFNLFPPQRTHVEKLTEAVLRFGIVLDSSSTGVGKTLCAIETARNLGRIPFVVCPKAVIPSWERMMDRQGVDYYEVATWAKMRRMTGKWFQSKMWKIPKNALLIFDECQAAKSIKTSQSQLVVKAKAQRIPMMLLSATPFTDPTEMWALGYALDFFKSPGYHRTWCVNEMACYVDTWNSLQFRGGNQAKKALDKINKRLYQDGYGSKIDRSDMDEYFTDTEISILYTTYAPETAKSFKVIYEGLETHLQKQEEDWEKGNESRLTEMLRARQEVELVKVPEIADHVKFFLGEGKSVVVFLSFNMSIDSLKEMLLEEGIPSVTIDGRNKKNERQNAIDQFQEDKVNVALVNLAAGGAGLSLHDLKGERPRVSLLNPNFSLLDMVQSLGRIDRAGAKTNTQQYILTTPGTIEEKIAEAVQRKETNWKSIFEQETKTSK